MRRRKIYIPLISNDNMVEKHGPFLVDPNVSRRIRRFHSSPRPNLESLTDISPEVIKRARAIVDLSPIRSNEYIPKEELLTRIRALRDIGYPLTPGYSKLSSAKLYGYFSRLTNEIERTAREYQLS